MPACEINSIVVIPSVAGLNLPIKTVRPADPAIGPSPSDVFRPVFPSILDQIRPAAVRREPDRTRILNRDAPAGPREDGVVGAAEHDHGVGANVVARYRNAADRSQRRRRPRNVE
jgi:hypothetical protein